ncbi:HalOD1 output domain-containing protein [Haloarcula onubensis]|uniref:Halobacterial output domain-containing protein n=1 Tax=Haloarcula onubensis TaxID=2950539 RepID=A0ABU2FLH9_9EURY|nr:HalOD1 output domain-containing protein [Halomicroarcula sp. S3CR25-11]MDS0281607.1 hypothetical protein [Halomicroarcula sp. S3CR25-11]
MDSQCASLLVVEEVARKEGVPPAELSPPLGRVIDAEALDKLVQSVGPPMANPAEVTFEYRDYTVRVQNDAEVRVAVEEASAPPEGGESTPEGRVEQSD